MTSRRTTVRALVPYQVPSNGVAFELKALLRRLFAEADKHFLSRRGIYAFLGIPVAWGLLFGGLFVSESVSTWFSLFLGIHCFAVFLLGMTIFGVVLIPVSVVWTFSSIGNFIRSDSSFFSSDSLLLFLFAFSYFFLASEGISTWKRGRNGWGSLVFHRDFLIFCFSMLISILFIL